MGPGDIMSDGIGLENSDGISLVIILGIIEITLLLDANITLGMTLGILYVDNLDTDEGK